MMFSLALAVLLVAAVAVAALRQHKSGEGKQSPIELGVKRLPPR